MEIRGATADEHEAIRAVVADAFAHHLAVVELVTDLRERGDIVVELVAIVGGNVVGHVALERAWVDDEMALAEVLVLSPLSVATDHQRRGVGTRLIEAALDAARERREGYVFLEGGPDYYGSRGFGPALARGFLRPSDRIPGPAFQVAVLEDRAITGRLVYPDTFWRHDATGLRGETLAEVRAVLGE